MVFEFACTQKSIPLTCDGHIKGHTSRHPLDCSRLCETAGKQVMTQIKNCHHLNFHRTWLGSMRRCHNSKSALGLAHTKFMKNLQKNSRHTLRIQLNYVAIINVKPKTLQPQMGYQRIHTSLKRASAWFLQSGGKRSGWFSSAFFL
jgi:hypothetical protein